LLIVTDVAIKDPMVHQTLSLSFLIAVSGFYVFTYNMMAGMVIGGISFVSGMVLVYHPLCQWYHIPLALSGMWFLYCALYWYHHPKIYESD